MHETEVKLTESPRYKGLEDFNVMHAKRMIKSQRAGG
jgi:hypothetical protein